VWVAVGNLWAHVTAEALFASGTGYLEAPVKGFGDRSFAWQDALS
jgi:hypothetical protein